MKNYVAISYIQEQLNKFNPEFVNCVIRSFEYIEETKAPDMCLSNSVALYICAKKYGYHPKLCYGLCEFDGYEFYHAWIEIDQTIIDIAIYGNVNYHFLFRVISGATLNVPYIGTYDNKYFRYKKFVFDDVWKYSELSQMEGLTFEKYIENSGNSLIENYMWQLICCFLDVDLSEETIEKLKPYIKNEKIQRK